MHAHTVLLAEDEPLIAVAICEALEALGYRVIVTDGGWDGLLTLCERYRPALTLLNFHGSCNAPDGMSAAAFIKEKYALPVALITGARYGDLAASPEFDLGVEVLLKPFTKAQLRKLVSTCCMEAK